MPKNSGRGQLIVFEGPDGIGKSTLAQALTRKLSDAGLPSQYLALPGNEIGTIGRLVYDIHHDPTVYGLGKLTAASLQALHIAAHLDAIEQRILPALNKGSWVILDRFWWSTWVYGHISAVDGDTLDALIQAEQLLWDGIKPTALFLIDRPSGLPSDHNCIQLRGSYQVLAQREQGLYPIRLIANDGSVEDSLHRMLAALRDITALVQSASWQGPDRAAEQRVEQPLLAPSTKEHTFISVTLSPARPTVVYESYWKFAVERQQVFFRKLEGRPAPWTTDPILARHKFTNAYRASDRVSQYLIRYAIYQGDQSPEEVFFRTILFRLFNKIETWEMLEAKLGTVSYADYAYSKYDQILVAALSSGIRIYSGAYIMPSGRTSFGYSQKHRNNLRLLERMMEDEVPHRIAEAPNMREAFELLRSYPTIGNFLAYQFVTDLNYSSLTDFSEMEFVVPGPGALDGIHKCFADFGGLNETDIIRLVTERQESEFARLGLEFRTLWGRRLQLIDCQNLFCEVSKYARLRHPDIKGANKRRRIKQIYRPSDKPIAYWYPPKWGINERIGGAAYEQAAL